MAAKLFLRLIVASLFVCFTSPAYAAPAPELQTLARPTTTTHTELTATWNSVSPLATYGDLAIATDTASGLIMLGMARGPSADHDDLSAILRLASQKARVPQRIINAYSNFVIVHPARTLVVFTNARTLTRLLNAIRMNRKLPTRNIVQGDYSKWTNNTAVSGLLSQDTRRGLDSLRGVGVVGNSQGVSFIALGSFKSGRAIFASTEVGFMESSQGISEIRRVGFLDLYDGMPVMASR